MKRIVIIGGGITGLAAAYRLEQLRDDVAITLIERSPQLGGKLQTERVDGFVIEAAPDSFLSRKPRGVGLCAELGIADQLHGRRPHNTHTYVRRHGQLHPLPTGLTGMIPTNLAALRENPLISPAGQARLAEEATIPPAALDGDESIANFVTRRLGPEVYEALVEPLMSGIYAGDGAQLSLAATFPQLRQLELKHGSLLNGLQQSTAAAAPAASAYPPFVSLPGGMVTLVEALTAALKRTEVVPGQAVHSLQRQAGGYSVRIVDGTAWHADAVILATPAFVTADLLATVAPELAALHREIPYASAAIITLAFETASLPNTLTGYGYVIPRVEESDLLACTWTSNKWHGRAPDGHTLLRVYAGRYGRRDVTELSDAELLAMAQAEIEHTLAIQTPPQRHWVQRWPQAMPQYLLGHPERLSKIDQAVAAVPGLFLAGAAYRGVGIPDCIESGERAATQAVAALSTENGFN